MPEGTPAVRVLDLSVFALANTSQFNPVDVHFKIEPVELLRVHVLVPTGVVGLAGWHLVWQRQVIVPWGNRFAWITGNGQLFTFNVGLVVTGELVVETYSDDLRYDHLIRAWAEVTDVGPGPGAAPSAPAPLVVLA